MMKKLQKKVIFYGVSIDIKQEENKGLIYDMFSWAFKVFVRDQASQEFLKNLVIESKLIWDPVFYDAWELEKKNSCIKSLQSSDFQIEDIQDIDFRWKIVGLALRSWYFWERDQNLFVRNFINYLLKAEVKKILLIPMSFHPTDYEANDRYFLEQFIQERVELAWVTMQTVYEVFKKKKMDICFAMRLHSIILSHIYEIPYIALSYSKKTDETIKKLSN